MTARNERPIYRLCEAARKGDARTVTRMVGRDPSLGRKGGPSGRTALWTAARWGHQGIVEFLLDAGGDIDGRCIESCRWAVPETPLIAAIRCGHPDVAEFLLARGARSDVYTACYTGDVAQVRRAVAEDAEIVNAADSDDPVMSLGMLHWALYGGQAFVVELLLASGADTDHSCGCQRIHEYGLPLSFALYFDRRLDLVEMLLEHGAAPTKGMLADAIGDGDRELLDLWARFGHRH
ncbi:MAG TPA: ankyrin repeat domain-containing protein, partial [Dehalococcoidia bacterium]|nr:ankyrin repeat domain-containing protein [Dehalococcoidia bacterium]